MLSRCTWVALMLRCLQAGVVELTSMDFDMRLQGGKERPWFVKFYAPWCGHCQRMASDWEKLASNLDGSIYVARVDAIREKELASEWGVEGFPTLKLISSEKVYTYQGPRTADKLEAWARTGWKSDFSDALPGKETDVVLLTGKTFEERLTSDLDVYWFVLFYAPSCQHCKSMAADFQEFAVRPSLSSRNVRVAKVNAEKDEELSGKWVTVGFPTMKLFADGKVYNYDGDRYADAMEEWVLKMLPPPPGLIQSLLMVRIHGMDPLLPVAFLLGLLAALLLWRVATAGQAKTSDAQDAPKKDD